MAKATDGFLPSEQKKIHDKTGRDLHLLQFASMGKINKIRGQKGIQNMYKR
jgi:hypothetical protein